MDGRTRRKHEAMRAVQDAALGLFEKRGYDAVTVDDVARAAEVGVASVYRNFGTKEAIVFWDEYDPALFEALSAELGRRPLAEAVRVAITTALDAFYARDAKRILRRTRLVEATPALRAFADTNLAALRRALAQAFVEAGACAPGLAAEVAAGAVASCLDAAVSAWAREKGKRGLGVVLDQAFAALAVLSSPPKRPLRSRTAPGSRD